MATKNIGFYPIHAKVEVPNLVGNPMLTVRLGVDVRTGLTHGTAEITQSVAPPFGNIKVAPVSGFTRRLLGSPENLREVRVKGQYVASAPAPAKGSWLADFSANLTLTADGNGEGNFSYGDITIRGCTVTNLDSADAEESFETADLETA
jgi:Domain of unknown function (DUF1842)